MSNNVGFNTKRKAIRLIGLTFLIIIGLFTHIYSIRHDNSLKNPNPIILEDSIELEIKQSSQILFVDDDNEETWESFFTNELDALGFSYDTTTSRPNAITMGQYDLVIWNTGDVFGTDYTTAESELITYLQGGGRLFLSSQDWIWDMGYTTFVSGYLGVISANQDSVSDGTSTIVATAGDAIGDGISITNISYPASFGVWGDYLWPQPNANISFYDSNVVPPTNAIAINYYNSTYDFKTVFFSVPFEAYNTNRTKLMERIIKWLSRPIITQSPEDPTPIDIVTITATLTSPENITSVLIYFSINENPLNSNSMNLISGTLTNGVWQGTIANQPAGTNVTYYVYFENNISDKKKFGPFRYVVSAIIESDPPELINITRLPQAPTDLDTVNITASLKDISGVASAQLLYQANVSGWNLVNLTLLQGTIYEGSWNGTIPAYGNGTIVRYYINATDTIDNGQFYPDRAPINTYGYLVGGIDNEAPPIVSSSYAPLNPTYQENVTITARVNMSLEISGLENLTLCYSIDGQPLNYRSMNYLNTTGMSLLYYNATLPTFSYGDTIYFNITSYDHAGNSNTTPTYNFSIGDRTSPLLTHSYSLERPNHTQNVQITAHATEPNDGSGIQNVTLFYTVNETALVSFESPHIVPNDYDYTWNITAPNCYQMELYFENISVEDTFDYLYIYNESFGLIQQFTGEHSQINITVPGNTSRIRLLTDFAIESWGFSLVIIKFYYNFQMLPMALSSGDMYDGDWTALIPKQGNISQVIFYCTAFDLANNSIVTPQTNYSSSERTLPTILELTQNPNGSYLKPTDSPVITVHASDNYGISPDGLTLQYFTGGSWTNLTMVSNCTSFYITDRFWMESIPAFVDGTLVDYRVIAQDVANNSLITANYSYLVDGTVPLLEFHSQDPLEPEYNDTVTLKLRLTDLYPSINGSGIDSVTMDYYYSKEFVLESNHPYQNNMNDSWTINYPGSLGIAVHFSQIKLSGGEVIQIYDGNDTLIESFVGTVTDQWSTRTYTEDIEIRLVTDSMVTNYGFLIDQYRIYYNSSLSIISGTIYDGIWNTSISSYSSGTSVWYDITVKDKAGNSVTILSGSYEIVDTFEPELINFTLSNENPTPDEDVNLTIEVEDLGAGIHNVTLWISIDGGITWIYVPFINLSNIWSVTIPKQPDHTNVKYYVEIHDNSGNVLRNPQSGYYSLQFLSITPFNGVLFLIFGISIIALVFFLLYLGNRLRLESLKESGKRSQPTQAAQGGRI